MRFWTSIDLTAAHRPVLYDDETDILVQDAVGIYEGRTRLPDYQSGRIYLTSHRICYVDNASPLLRSVAINLPDIKAAQYSVRFLKSSPKITIEFADKSSSTSTSPVYPSSASSTPNASSASLPAPSAAASASNLSLVSSVSWVCPICSFSNPFSSNYRPDISPIPACATCGVKPPESVIKDALTEGGITSGSASPDSTSSQSTSLTEPDSDSIACPKCTFANNPALRFCEICGSRLRVSTLNVSDYILDKSVARKESYLPFSFSSSSSGADSERSKYAMPVQEEVLNYVKLSFRGGGDKEFFERLKVVLTDKTWLQNAARRKQEPSVIVVNKTLMDNEMKQVDEEPKPPATPTFGIHGLQRINEREREDNKDLMGSLNDLQSLMTKARGLVALAENFAVRLASSPGVPDEARRALRESSNALNLSSPIVTKEMAGGGSNEIYYAELARQLAEFLESGVLKNEGGIVTLVDLFALYNRARGISLISAKDLRSACDMFEKLRLPFKLRQFKSGLIVVQEAARADSVAIAMLVEWVKTAQKKPFEEDDGVTAQDVSQHFGWNVGVSMEELETAQEQGKLVSDSVVGGTRYFINTIVSFSWDWKLDVFKEKTGQVANALDLAALEEDLSLLDPSSSTMVTGQAYVPASNIHRAVLTNENSLL
ncbi:EAP30/Vps36 family-domain-containing protein [Myxozyma melibiosi]|uniref:Vacuolar protein-sorting-associated protein 36 n=1 Tax=Myxozyma melibiosi TaxID=54550 RepID=A0ABR1FC62_9ASCO